MSSLADRISLILESSGLLSNADCFACDVCCRFPEPTTHLSPWFSRTEQARALTAGLRAEDFLPGAFGAGQPICLRSGDELCTCPGFEPAANRCTMYPDRPLDCRLYPFMLMYEQGGSEVWLGLDTYCPVLGGRVDDPRLSECADRLAAELEGPGGAEAAGHGGMVSDRQTHFTPLRRLDALTRHLCRNDLGLARAVPSAFDAWNEFLAREEDPLFGHAPAAIHIWSRCFDLRWKVSADCLLVFAQAEGDAFLLLPPLGGGDVCAAAAEAVHILEGLEPDGRGARIQNAGETCRERLASCGWRSRESETEYLYRRADVAALKGNRYEKKRQLCNRFERDHNWTWRPFEPRDFPQVLSLARSWLAERSAVHSDFYYVTQAEASLHCLAVAIRDAEALSLASRVLESDGRIIAVTAGYPLPDGRTFCVLFEFVDHTVRGAAAFVYREFCRELGRYELINAGGTSGLPNLERVKRSWRPCATREAWVLLPPARSV